MSGEGCVRRSARRTRPFYQLGDPFLVGALGALTGIIGSWPLEPTPCPSTSTAASCPASRFGPEPDPSRTVLAVHGITASAMAWPAVAAALPEDWSLVALDLRGRGASRDLPGPFGLAAPRRRRRRGRRAAATPRPPASWCSPGTRWAPTSPCWPPTPDPTSSRGWCWSTAAYPCRCPRAPTPTRSSPPPSGPALERLRTTYASVDEYVEFFRQHPALGPALGDTIEDYVRYDALETPDGVRSRAVDEAVRADGRDLLVRRPALDAALRGLTLPTPPAGRAARDVRPGARAAARCGGRGRTTSRWTALTVETVPDVNHYTILFDPDAAARVAAVIADG